MNQIKLRKLLLKGDSASIVKEYLESTKEPVLVKDEDGIILGYEEETGSFESCPIKCGNDIIGWITCGSKSQMAANFISYIADSEREKKELASETLERYREINLLYKLSEKLSATFDFNMVVRIIINEAMKYIASSFSSVILINEDTGKFEVISEFYKREDFNIVLRSDEPTIKFSEEFLKKIILKKKTEIINNIVPEEMRTIDTNRITEIICAPLMIKNNAIGIMIIGHKKDAMYTAHDIKLFNTIAVQAAFAIENAKLYRSLNETLFDTVQTLADTMEKRDGYTAGHSKRVANYCLSIAKAMDMPQVDVIKLKLAAMLHDIGKVGISDWILIKHDNLKGKDLEKVKQHPEYGAQIVNSIKRLKDIVPAIRGHHERYDGLGYPDGLRGEQIPVFARIIAVADAFDVMVTGRGQRDGISETSALGKLKDDAGTLYDPHIVNTFISCVDKSSAY